MNITTTRLLTPEQMIELSYLAGVDQIIEETTVTKSYIGRTLSMDRHATIVTVVISDAFNSAYQEEIVNHIWTIIDG